MHIIGSHFPAKTATDHKLQGWQKRLSAEHIATFPWDPKPEPIKAEPVLGSNVKPNVLPSHGAGFTPPSSGSTPGPQIKQEHQQYATQPPPSGYPSQYPQAPSTNAHERASVLLQQRYGAQAASQINQLQNHQRIPQQANFAPSQPQQQQPQPQQPQQPYIKQEIKQEDGGYNYPPQNYNHLPPIKHSQVDGAADVREQYDSELARHRAFLAQNPGAGDRLIRQRVEASQQAVEGGGLMMPLSSMKAEREPLEVGSSSRPRSSLARAQGDGAGDEDDEDAINSDLDDPDELADAAEDDENVNNVMLCTYDKVQRVKNKWKCTLKDGILKVDGSE